MAAIPRRRHAGLPAPEGRHSSIVWSVPHGARRDGCSRSRPRHSNANSRTDLDGALGKVKLASERLKFPLWRLSAEHVRDRARRAGGRCRARGASAGGAGREPRPARCRGAGGRARRGPAASREDPGAERILRRYERWRRSENESDEQRPSMPSIGCWRAARAASRRSRNAACRGWASPRRRSACSSSAPWGLAGELPAAAR